MNPDAFQKVPKIAKVQDVIQTVHRLRAPGGCPWDRAQTHQSLRQYLIEESYEVLDVLDRIETTDDLKKEPLKLAFKEELGDLLMQVLLHSEMTREAGAFDFNDVAAALDDKLIRRHPHVFGDAAKVDSTPEGRVSDEKSAFETWEKQKAKEKSANPDASVLDGVPRGLPSLQRAARVLEKVTKVGFQWKDLEGPLAKVDEELGEMKVEALAYERAAKDSPAREDARRRLEGEIGDLLFTLCNVAYLSKVNPEDALRGTMARFEGRFKHVEKRLKEAGKTPEQSDLAEMDRFWDEAKKLGK